MSSVSNADRTQPWANWEEIDILFPAVAGTDIVVPHTLAPVNPENVNYVVIRNGQQAEVYHDTAGTRTPWQVGYIILRASVPLARVTILATVSQTPRAPQFGLPGVPSAPTAALGTSTTQIATTAFVNGAVYGTVVTNTQTGALNDWNPGIVGNTFVLWSGASDATISGFATGVAGQTLTIRNNNGSANSPVIYLPTQSALSLTAGRLVNYVVSGPTPIGGRGTATYQYDGSNWKLVAHDQGFWITPTYAAGDYTASAGTWGVDVGDVLFCRWKLSGSTLHFKMGLFTTSVSATPATLVRVIPNGFTTQSPTYTGVMLCSNNGATVVPATVTVAAAATVMNFAASSASAAWATSVNLTNLYGEVQMEIA